MLGWFFMDTWDRFGYRLAFWSNNLNDTGKFKHFIAIALQAGRSWRSNNFEWLWVCEKLVQCSDRARTRKYSSVLFLLDWLVCHSCQSHWRRNLSWWPPTHCRALDDSTGDMPLPPRSAFWPVVDARFVWCLILAALHLIGITLLEVGSLALCSGLLSVFVFNTSNYEDWIQVHFFVLIIR